MNTFDIVAVHHQRADEMRVAFRKTAALLKGNNAQDTGDCREAIVKDAIHEWLPTIFTSSRGQMVSGADLRVTRPIDILIAEAAEHAPLLRLNGATQFLADGVRVAVEVKSVLDYADYFNAVAKLSQASWQKHSQGGENALRFATILFAFDGPVKPETVQGWYPDVVKDWRKIKADHPADWKDRVTRRPFLPNCVVVLGKYVVCDMDFRKTHWLCQNHQGVFRSTEAEDDTLLVLHAFLESRLDLNLSVPLYNLLGRNDQRGRIQTKEVWEPPKGFGKTRIAETEDDPDEEDTQPPATQGSSTPRL